MGTNEEFAEQLRGRSEDLGCKTMPQPGPVELWLRRVKGDITQLERVCRRNEQYPTERAAHLYSQRLNEALDLVDSVPGLGPPDLETSQPVRTRLAELREWGRKALGQEASKDGPERALETETEVLSENDLTVLEYLNEEKTPKKQHQIAAATRLSRHTISDLLIPLRKQRLVGRPKGERGGEALTDLGRRAVGEHGR